MKKSSGGNRTYIGLSIVVLFGVLCGVIYSHLFKEAPILHGKTIYDIEYKEGLTLDVYLPINRVYEETPVVVYFHGGAWIVGRKETINIDRYHGAIKKLRTEGYAIVSPEYTLARKDKPPFPNCIIDAYDVVRWITYHGSEYNFDKNNIGVFGESAGAHIALMAAYANPKIFSTSLPEINIKYVVDVYGPNDLKSLYEIQAQDSTEGLLAKLPEPLRNQLDIESYLLGFDPEEDTLRARDFFKKYSPIEHVNGNVVPTLMIHGNADILVPLAQTLALGDKLEKVQVFHETHILDGVNHAFIGVSDEQYNDVQKWISDFIQRQYNE